MSEENVVTINPATEKENMYTVFWLDGTKSFISGPSIEVAFTKAGYGGGSINAVDWYDNGIVDTHYFDKKKHMWERYVEVNIKSGDFTALSPEKIKELLNKHHCVSVVFPSKNVLQLNYAIGCYYQLGYVDTINITFAEYFSGSYSGDPEDGDHHYMCLNGEYFHRNNEDLAIEAFIKRFNEAPTKQSGLSQKLEEIAETSIKY